MISNLVNNNCYLITLISNSNDQIYKKQLSSTEFSSLLKSIRDSIEINIGNYEIQIENEMKYVSHIANISSNSIIKKQKPIIQPKKSINITATITSTSTSNNTFCKPPRSNVFCKCLTLAIIFKVLYSRSIGPSSIQTGILYLLMIYVFRYHFSKYQKLV